MRDDIMVFFNAEHLPGPLKAASEPFCNLAIWLDRQFPKANPEVDVALRKLLEAKDAAVRALVLHSRHP